MLAHTMLGRSLLWKGDIAGAKAEEALRELEELATRER